jgi:exosortase
MGSPWGLILLLPALLLHLIAGLADVSSLSGMFLIPAIMGFAALLHGTAFLKAAAFPIFFLIFMVPPPEFVISTLNFSLKLLAADTAEWLLNFTGVAAVRQGSFMLFGSEKLAIGDVCSGLRSLLSLIALSVLYGWMVRTRGKTHLAGVLLAAIPAAIIGNGVRIFLVSYLVLWLGQDAVFKPILGDWDLYLFTGSIIFAAALGCLFAITAICDHLPGSHMKVGNSSTNGETQKKGKKQ